MLVLDIPNGPVTQDVTDTLHRPVAHETLGICQFAENPSEPDNAANMLSAATEVENHFADRHWKLPAPVVAKVLHPPRHGALTSDHPGIFTYRPAAGYMGHDRVTIVATVGPTKLRLEYFVRVVQFVPVDDLQADMYARGDCPVNLRTWTIKTSPRE